MADAYSQEIQDALEPFVYELVGESNIPFTLYGRLFHVDDDTGIGSYSGSVSAEHGIGAMKTHALRYSKNETSIAWMRKIKHLFDERGIMNPGKVLD